MEKHLKNFEFVAHIVPECDEQNRVKEFSPYKDYDNKDNISLDKYGLGPFCHFGIPNKFHDNPGVYVIMVENRIRYVGECENLVKRYNFGYGNISPRNCFKGGQTTNCKINSLILNEYKLGRKINLFFCISENRFELERHLISAVNPDWNSTAGKRIKRERTVMGKTSIKKQSSYSYDTKKYRPLEDYLSGVKDNSITLSFSEIEKILDAKLPKSAYTYQAWWANGGHNYANAWLNMGWKVEEVKFGEYVKFIKVS